MPGAGGRARRAVLSSPRERPVGVTAVTGFLLILALVLLVAGVWAAVFGWIYTNDRLENPGHAGALEQRAAVTDLFVYILSSLAMLGGATLLACVAVANGRGRKWAWTGISVAAILLSVPALLFVTGFVWMLVDSSNQEEGVGAVLVVSVISLAIIVVVFQYYRRDEVRAWFGLPSRPGTGRPPPP